MYFRLAYRNVFRQRTRSAVTLLAISFGVTALMLSGGFINDIFHQLGEAIVHSQTGHIQVFKQGYRESGNRDPGNFMFSPTQFELERIGQVPGVAHLGQRISFRGLVGNGKRDLPIIGEGVQPDVERQIGNQVRITEGRDLSDADQFGVVLGEGLARTLNIGIGQRVTVLVNSAGGAVNVTDFQVLGTFQSFSKDFDARALKIRLEDAQTLLSQSGINTIVVGLSDTGLTQRTTEAVKGVVPPGLEVMDWQQLSDFYEKTIALYDRQFSVLQIIVLFMVVLSVTNSINMSLWERMGEFGTLLAVGNRQKDLFRLLMAEGVVLGATGTLVGAVLGMMLAGLISYIGIPMPPPPSANMGYTAKIILTPGVVATSMLIGFVATIAATVLPARRAAKTPVVDGLRQAI